MSQVHAHNVAISPASFGAGEGLTLEVCYVIEAVPAPQVSLQAGPLVETETNPVGQETAATVPDPPGPSHELEA